MYKIDVIIPVQNGEKYIKEALTSVLDQTLFPNKIFIIDDGSSDKTPNIIEEFKKQYPIIFSVRINKSSASAARNEGIRLSDANFIAFLDADDVWFPEKLEEQLKVFINASESLGLVQCAYTDAEANGNISPNSITYKPTLRGKVYFDVMNKVPVTGSASGVLVRRKVFDQVGGFDENLCYGEDWDMWIRIAKNYDFDFTCKILLKIRCHNESITRRPDKKKLLRFTKSLVLVHDKHSSYYLKNAEPFLDHLGKEIAAAVLANSLRHPIRVIKFIKDVKNIPLIKSLYPHFYLFLFKGAIKIPELTIKVFICKIWFGYHCATRKYVKVKLTGGLGDQMFQYAAALSLARKYNTVSEVVIDKRTFKKYLLWPYHLDKFHIPQLFSPPIRFFRIFLAKKIRIFDILESTKLTYNELYFHFDKQFFKQKIPILLDGYFQSYKYFENIKPLLQERFQPKDTSLITQKYVDLIKKSKVTVSLHVRRSDYTSNQADKYFHGTLAIDYYIKAISLIKEKEGKNILFLIFSDDIAYVTEKFQFLPHKIIVEGNKNNPTDMLFLMSYCTHNIIANSDLSWWGAWLNKNESKIVIAPKEWFAPKTLETVNIDDLFPKEWILL